MYTLFIRSYQFRISLKFRRIRLQIILKQITNEISIIVIIDIA